MAVVRYVALAALVFWLGGMMQALTGGASHPITIVAFACGAVILVGLFVMKFVGPPPHAFVARVALVAAMLAVAAAASTWGQSRTALTINLTLGLVLLSWYARE